ncbi:1-acyl-sn-glycerol-3-phosphate acyltransferase, partial [Roseisolibacter sp. H3M3-2]|uniref:1-acyl-sn-glycerol-3-phosphate acyltransferase n=1 Tax=Roseisolibacter sp. H3M3-2 TaxID=3031323 RepID=UPI0023DC8730
MPVHHQVARFAAFVARTYYRLQVEGAPPPAEGPLLVVANHPNSLLDPAMVTLAVGRPARFLAKAPLFTDRNVGWLVRASGAIPVHRQQDASPNGSGQARSAANDDTFRAAEAALVAGDAIALFPEGISHAQPGLAPLKTGAARLALQTAAALGGAFPIVPVGITLDDRAIFRSAGLLAIGAPVAWDDLAAEAVRDARAGAAPGEPARVRALTARIGAALHSVTASFGTWEDARLVALADEVHAAAAGATASGAARLGRRRLGAELLARLRDDAAAPPPVLEALRHEAAALGEELRRHRRLLGALRLTPADLAEPTDLGTAAGWAVRRLHLPVLGALAAVGAALGYVPYQLTGRVAMLFPGSEASDVRATAKALVGALLFLAWTLLLAGLAWAAVGGWAALATLLLVPPLLLLSLTTTEGWAEAWREARRFLTLRARPGRVAELRARQAALAARAEALFAGLEQVGGQAVLG